MGKVLEAYSRLQSHTVRYNDWRKDMDMVYNQLEAFDIIKESLFVEFDHKLASYVLKVSIDNINSIIIKILTEDDFDTIKELLGWIKD